MIDIRLKGGYRTTHHRLDRVPSQTGEHFRRFPLTASIVAALPPTPMAAGVNWYEACEDVRDERGTAYVPGARPYGAWWMGRDRTGGLRPDAGDLLGGHCFALKQRGATDLTSWWDYYNQGSEGRCVQFGVSRMMSLLNRKRYEVRDATSNGRWLYYEAQRIDEWDGGSYPGANPSYEGTSVNAGLNVIRHFGLIPYRNVDPVLAEGISEFRWARDYDDVKRVLGYADKNYVDVLNSWGREYPHLVRMPDDIGAKLYHEDGEFGVVTDRL